MATLRRAGFGSVFEVENEKVGIGTTGTATNTLQVLGDIKSSDAKILGISTLTTYQGFVDKEARFGKEVIDVESQAGTLGEVIIEGDVTVSSASTLCSSVDELTLTDSFSVPTGNTGSRIHCHTAGSMRFNEDLGTLEFYTGDEWRTVNSFKDSGNRGRAVFTGGAVSTFSNVIDFVNIATLGNAIDFGTSITIARFAAACSSETRGVSSFGYKSPGSYANELEYITIASEGNSIDFGDSTTSAYAQASLSSSTRGIWLGGQTPSGYSNVIDFITIGTLGDAVNFGDITTPIDGAGGFASPTRGVIGGGRNPSSGSIGINQIQFITIASKGNAVDDGELTQRRKNIGGLSNTTRGVFSGGRDGAAGVQFSTIAFGTIASLGDATDFGNLTFTGAYGASASSQTRGVTALGRNSPANLNMIDYITIATTGDAQDFGDLTITRYALGGLSDSHGGLGGF